MPDTKPTKQTIASDQYRRFAVDTFSLRASDNNAQLTFALETVNEKEEEIVVREGTAVMTLRSLKVLQIVLTNVLEKLERDTGPIQLPPGKEDQLRSQLERKPK